jgi:ubiquinone/menaquinone biosynthesis C-methylase UbiE
MSTQASDWSAVSEQRRHIMPKYMGPMWDALLDATGAGPGKRLLDAGCGSGELLVRAIQRGCQITGTDVAPGMIEVCRTTPALAGADFHVTSTEQLPFEDNTFDIAIASMSIHFCDDVPRAMRELYRVLKPGGRIGISGPSSPSLQVLIVFRLAMELVPDEADNLSRPMMFAEDGKLAAALEAIGIREIGERFADAAMVGPFEELWEAEKTWAPIRRACEIAGEAEFLRAYQQRMFEQTGVASPTRLDLAYRVVSGVKPL